MAKFSKNEVLQKLEEVPIVPLFTHTDFSVAKSVMKACYDGGIRVFEYTNRSSVARQIFIQLVEYARLEMPDLAIGIGTIFHEEEASYFIENDADFIIQPTINEKVGILCSQHNVAWIPGVMTINEIYLAQLLGADVIKIFPANILGNSFIKAVRGPLPHVKLMATGGVMPTVENLNAWFTSGVSCVGIGSQLCPTENIETNDYSQLQRNVEACVAFTKNFKI